MARTLERQSGKTTLVQATFPDKPCVSLDARLFFWRDKIGSEVDLPAHAMMVAWVWVYIYANWWLWRMGANSRSPMRHRDWSSLSPCRLLIQITQLEYHPGFVDRQGQRALHLGTANRSNVCWRSD